MSDKEKFEGFKRELIEEKERLYGKEARENMAKRLLMRQIKKLWDCPRQITRDLKI